MDTVDEAVGNVLMWYNDIGMTCFGLASCGTNS